VQRYPSTFPAALRLSLCSLALLLTACESAPPTAERRPTSHPATAPTASAPTAQPPASQPAATQPTAPASQPSAAGPELPEYLTIVERFKPAERAAAQVTTETGNRLVIDTRNVRRLRIDRDRVPLNQRRSIALLLDGQGLEWLPHSKVVEFERSVNGGWTPVKP